MTTSTQSQPPIGTFGSLQRARNIIWALLRSRSLSVEDQLNLALTNKSMAGVVDIERSRLNVMDVPFEFDDSLINQAIKCNRQDWLEYLLGIGDFTSEEGRDSINGLFLHCCDDSDGEYNRIDHTMGTHQLMELCLRFDAVRCLQSLIKYCDETCFNYDPDWLYRRAMLAAWKEYRVQCLVFLHSYLQRSDGRPLKELWSYLLTQAWTSFHVRALTQVMTPGTDYFPYLVLQCARGDECSPFVLLDLIKRVPTERLGQQVNFRGMSVTPLSLVSRGLRLSTIKLLLERGGVKRPFEHYHRDPVKGLLTNPLFTLLIDISLPSQEDPWYVCSESPKDWLTRVGDMAKDLRTVVKLFERYAREEFQFDLRKHVEMNAVACTLFINLLREWFIGVIMSSLNPDERDKLLRCQSPDDDGAWDWKEGISSSLLRSVLTSNDLNLLDRNFIRVWDMLRTHEVEQEAEALLLASSNSDREKEVSWTSVEYLYAFITAPQRKEVAEFEETLNMVRAPSELPDLESNYGDEKFENVIQKLQGLRIESSLSVYNESVFTVSDVSSTAGETFCSEVV
ncbi:hypothetical protein B0T21DRAFT_433534 [Apiosordaria backusii]|uniref:Uncharacterized protein n=1 Tax=Apiosordaria backusii TaxID=314023 RepID=A0AA40EMB8_9PEZI|nr:hypothetical protein B0T21DRAFT_433534 [Apiosordaria backusii]